MIIEKDGMLWIHVYTADLKRHSNEKRQNLALFKQDVSLTCEQDEE